MYQLTETGVLRLEDNAWIPDCPENRDWMAYQAWRKEGNSPLPMPSPPSPINYAVLNGQARQQRQQAQQQALQTQINRYVLETMTWPVSPTTRRRLSAR